MLWEHNAVSKYCRTPEAKFGSWVREGLHPKCLAGAVDEWVQICSSTASSALTSKGKQTSTDTARACLGWSSHCLLSHLALVHITRALIEVAVGSQRRNHTQHCSWAELLVCECNARSATRASIRASEAMQPSKHDSAAPQKAMAKDVTDSQRRDPAN